MAVTMRDVAERAGVSIKTVSRVVNRQGEISDETRQRVQEVIDELGYRPNVLARGLVSGHSQAVGMVIPRITDPFFPEVVLGVEHIARQRGYNVFLCNANDSLEQELESIAMLVDRRVDGVILCSSSMDEEQLTQMAAQHPISVLTSHHPQGMAVVSVSETDAVFQVVNHLIRLGHREIGHIPVRHKHSHPWRMDGYRRALRAHGIEGQERWVAFAEEIGVQAGYEAARRLLALAPELTAISCYNDLVAVGTLQACAALGRRVPEDVAVTGFDDIELGSLVIPRLTTVRMPRHLLGERLMEGLLRLIESGGEETVRYWIELEVVMRESSGAIPGTDRPLDKSQLSALSLSQ